MLIAGTVPRSDPRVREHGAPTPGRSTRVRDAPEKTVQLSATLLDVERGVRRARPSGITDSASPQNV